MFNDIFLGGERYTMSDYELLIFRNLNVFYKSDSGIIN